MFTDLHSQRTARHPVCLSLREIAVLDIEPSNAPISISFNSFSESGKKISTPSEVLGNWLNYTSAVSLAGDKRTVTVEAANEIPSGISLFIEARSYEGNGAGSLGKTTGKIELTQQPKAIISNIGGCYTGNGSGNGHRLIYTASIKDYGEISASSNTNVQVIFTITE